MKPTRIRMTHSLVMNYGLYKKMEIFVCPLLLRLAPSFPLITLATSTSRSSSIESGTHDPSSYDHSAPNPRPKEKCHSSTRTNTSISSTVSTRRMRMVTLGNNRNVSRGIPSSSYPVRLEVADTG